MPKKFHTRRRRLPNKFTLGSQTFSRNNPGEAWKLSSSGARNLSGIQLTESEGHHWPAKKKATNDEGGPFFTTKSYVDYIPSKRVTLFNKSSNGSEHKFEGYLAAIDPGDLSFTSGFFPKVPGSSDTDMDKYGTLAIKEKNPVKSVAELSVALGEIARDGIPRLPGISLWEKRLRPYLGVADEFLNYAFGWAPLIKDILDTRDAIMGHNYVLEQYARDAGKVVRREFNFPRIESSDGIITGNKKARSPGLGSQLDDDARPGITVAQTETTIKRWFSGAFTYWLPSELDSWKKLMGSGSTADKLFGTNLDAQTLWEITPWSWAIDYFTNVGDVLANIDNFVKDGSVMRYGYMMEESTVKTTYSMMGSSGLRTYNPSSGKYSPVPLSVVGDVTVTTVTKKRRVANPYGFGVSWEGLSTFQQAILAALGITRRG